MFPVFVKAHYLDASALVKLVADDPEEEPGRDVLRTYYWHYAASMYATSYCITEAFSAFKRKSQRGQITENQYIKYVQNFIQQILGANLRIDEVPILSSLVYTEAERLIKVYKIDFLDCFQIVTILRGQFHVLGPESKSILITGDRKLAEAARGFALLLLVLLGTGMGQGQDQSHDGYWWAGFPSNYKLGFATGYAMAMTNAYDRASIKCLADKNGGTLPEKYPGHEALKACLESPTVTPFDFESIRIGQLAEGADEFYKDFRNKGIDIILAMSYVRDQLKGKPAKELEDELALWRRPARALIGAFRRKDTSE